jgi:hypothetical protein
MTHVKLELQRTRLEEMCTINWSVRLNTTRSCSVLGLRLISVESLGSVTRDVVSSLSK